MTGRCILQWDACRRPDSPERVGPCVLLLSPAAEPELELNRQAKIWLQIRLSEADLPVREVSGGGDSESICELCRAIDEAVAVLADVSIRDSLVYLGMTLAHNRGKLVRYLAHREVKLSDQFGKVLLYPDGNPLPTDFDKGIRDLIHDIRTGPPPPPPPQIDGKRLREIWTAKSGDRTAEQKQWLADVWAQLLVPHCCSLLPLLAPHQKLISNWHEFSVWDGFPVLWLPAEVWREAQPFLTGPDFRHALEDAIFELTGGECNWPIHLTAKRVYWADDTLA